MKLEAFKALLREAPDAEIRVELPGKERVAAHFHLTEVAYRSKDFFDCGGTRRKSEVCALQLWVALDFDHRLKASKVLGILDKSAAVFPHEQLEIEVDHQRGSLCSYRLGSCRREGEAWVLVLEGIQAECLAPDRCGLTPELMPEGAPNFNRLPRLD